MQKTRKYYGKALYLTEKINVLEQERKAVRIN